MYSVDFSFMHGKINGGTVERQSPKRPLEIGVYPQKDNSPKRPLEK